MLVVMGPTLLEALAEAVVPLRAQLLQALMDPTKVAAMHPLGVAMAEMAATASLPTEMTDPPQAAAAAAQSAVAAPRLPEAMAPTVVWS